MQDIYIYIYIYISSALLLVLKAIRNPKLRTQL